MSQLRQSYSDFASSRYQQYVLSVSPILSPASTTCYNHAQPDPVIMDEGIMDPFFAQMHAQNWVSPSAIPWDGWGFLSTGQYGMHQGGSG